MRKIAMAATFALAAVLALAGFAAGQEGQPKYVFIFIGDGTSFPQRNAAEYYRASLAETPSVEPAILRAQKKISKNTGITTFKPNTKRLTMNTFPAQGLSTTYSYNSLITDSSSSGTAIATGNKTVDGYVSVDPQTGKVPFTSVAKIAKAQGKKVGIVTSVSLDHATPAAFYANHVNRNAYYEIATQGPKTGFDYFAGGYFLGPKDPKGEGKDTVDVYKEYGYTVSNNRAGFERLSKADGKILAYNQYLDLSNAIPFEIDRTGDSIKLSEFVKKGIEILDNDAGFFMMCEGGKVDWGCHANDALTAILEVIQFDEAVEVAYDWYLKHPKETLIVVTGDHETGGMTVGFAGTRYDTFLDRIKDQKGSYEAITIKIGEMKKQYASAPKIDQLMPWLTADFGFQLVPAADLAKLEKAAGEGDVKAINTLKLALQPWEVETIEKAAAMSWVDKKERPGDDNYYATYGSYEPLTVALTQTLNNKAGIAWTTFSHSGLPTPVSAIGVGCENFVGHYDNTDIFKKVVAVAYK